MTTSDMEIYLSNYFDIRRSLIVPNVSWGMGVHECDLFCVSKSGYVTEVEIKVSKSDLLKDSKKKHNHNSAKIKYLYFAVPEKLGDIAGAIIPENSGLIVVNDRGCCRVVKKPVARKYARKLSDSEIYKVARLGTLRAWSYKHRIAVLEKRIKQYKEETNVG